MNLFGPQHEQFRQSAREFVETHLTPHANEWEQQRELPRRVFQELGAAGMLGLSQSRADGGRGLDFAYNVVLAEELVRSRAFGLVLSVIAQAHFFTPLLATLGTEEHRRRFLMPAIRGEAIGCLAVTEPTGGSDIIHAVECTATEEGDCWVISGEKKYITNGPIADFVVLLARTKPEKSTTSLSLIVLPTTTPGFAVRETLQKLGLHTSPTGWLTFDHCRVDKNLTLGKPHLGFFYVSERLLEERLIAGVIAIAIADLVLHETVAYLQHRRVYETTLAKLQAVRHSISDMAAEVEMARRFVYSVCESYRDGKVEAKQICMAKFKVVEIAQRTIERCLQLHGGYGFLEENWITRAYRDMRVLSVGGGASELMKDLVAGYLRL
jgi:alkylation response protein AidB-like acyl-CoA dehydrogenase